MSNNPSLCTLLVSERQKANIYYCNCFCSAAVDLLHRQLCVYMYVWLLMRRIGSPLYTHEGRAVVSGNTLVGHSGGNPHRYDYSRAESLATQHDSTGSKACKPGHACLATLTNRGKGSASLLILTPSSTNLHLLAVGLINRQLGLPCTSYLAEWVFIARNSPCNTFGIAIRNGTLTAGKQKKSLEDIESVESDKTCYYVYTDNTASLPPGYEFSTSDEWCCKTCHNCCNRTQIVPSERTIAVGRVISKGTCS